uniref:Uncharacterized protein n=1 Tax=Romanomermis culicivorax TaxID=13658 RepID=A0A915HQC1_ROMCU
MQVWDWDLCVKHQDYGFRGKRMMAACAHPEIIGYICDHLIRQFFGFLGTLCKSIDHRFCLDFCRICCMIMLTQFHNNIDMIM